jgi:hypothetical protein
MNDLTRAFAQAFDGQLELFDIRNRQYHAPGCLVLQRQASDEQLPGGQPIASTQRTKVDPQTAADGQSKLRSVDLALVLSNGDSNLAFGSMPQFQHLYTTILVRVLNWITSALILAFSSIGTLHLRQIPDAGRSCVRFKGAFITA